MGQNNEEARFPDLKRFLQYLSLIDGGQQIELYPPPEGLINNVFEYVDHMGSHVKLRNVHNGNEIDVALSMVEFVNPAPSYKGPATIILKRQMSLRGQALV